MSNTGVMDSGSPPSKSAIADLDTFGPISGKPEIGGVRNDDGKVVGFMP